MVSIRTGLSALALLLFANPSALAAPSQIHLSWQGPPTTTMTVVWRAAPANGQVEYGTTTAYGSKVSSSATAYDGSHLHEATITGLQPGTTYHYRCGSGSDWSSDRTFTTAPQNPASYRYVALGDSRDDIPNLSSVRSAVLTRKPAFVVHTGDFVGSGTSQSQWNAFFNAMEPLASVAPLLGALGNHEGKASIYFQQFAFPTHSPTTSGIPNESYYSFNYGSTHVIALSTEHSPTVGDDQSKWLAQDLAKAAKDPAITFIVAFAHQPPYSSGPHGSSTSVQKAWGPLFESHGVDVTFWGHDHTYERTKPMFQGYPVQKGGVTYIVTGGAGAPLYTAKGASFTASVKAAYHFVEINVQGSQMTLDMRETNGQVFDSFTLTKPLPKPLWAMDGTLDSGTKQLGTGGSELKTLHAAFDGRYLYLATQGMPAQRDHFILVADKKPTTLRSAPWKKTGQTWTQTAMLAMESSSGWTNWQDPGASAPIIAMGSTWKYHDQGQDLGSGWTGATYNDSAWKSGPAQLGYGDGDEKTVLTKTSPVYPSAYFRKTFTLGQVPSGATLKVLHDDGVVVWINGQQVFSKYASNGTTYSAWASDSSSDNETSSTDITQTSGTPFVQGQNVIAVMVKQSSSSSSDLSFDLQLELKAAEQTGFSRAANPAGTLMEGLIDLKERFGAVPPSVFLAAAGYGTLDGQGLQEQIPAGNGNGDLDLGEWIEFKLLTGPGPDAGVDGPMKKDGPAKSDGPQKPPDTNQPGHEGIMQGDPKVGPSPDDDGGCTCTLDSRSDDSALAVILLGALFLGLSRGSRRRSPR